MITSSKEAYFLFTIPAFLLLFERRKKSLYNIYGKIRNSTTFYLLQSECFQESEHLKESLKCCLLHLFGAIVAGGQVRMF